MKKLMDLYTNHTESFMERKEEFKSASRVMLNEKGRFEGITTDSRNQPVSFIFGNIVEDEIEVYEMPVAEGIEPISLKGKKDGYKYQGTYSILIEGFEVETKEPCEMIISDGDMIREVKDDEIEFVIKATKKIKRNLSGEKKNVYDSYVSKFKKKNDDIKEKFAIKK